MWGANITSVLTQASASHPPELPGLDLPLDTVPEGWPRWGWTAAGHRRALPGRALITKGRSWRLPLPFGPRGAYKKSAPHTIREW